MNLPQYDHIQRGKLHYILHITALAIAAICLITIPAAAGQIRVYIAIGTTAMLEFLAFSCITLHVYDDENCLQLKYGPLPLMKKHIAYADIVATRPSRSKFIDGWGIHYIPGRGWTYNLWGFNCVELTMIDNKIIRVGTDQPAQLDAFLQDKISD